MMINQPDCMGRCEKSLVFQFINTARWLALLLMITIASTTALLQYTRQQPVNWLFFTVCVVAGGILFWIGNCLIRSECASHKRTGRCRRMKVEQVPPPSSPR